MDFTPGEIGFVAPPPPTQQQLPPGDGRWTTPQFLTFASLFQAGHRGHRWWRDEALRHSHENARAMRNDCSVMEALRARQMPTAMLSWHLEPQDEANQRQADAVTLIEDILTAMPKFQQLRMHLLEALWYGHVGCQIRYRWDFGRPNPFTADGRRLIPTGHQYLNGDKLRFKWDGTAGVMVHAGFPGTKESTDYGWAHFFDPAEREGFVVHRHEPDDADYLEADLSGGIEGYGIRGRVYWYWYVKQQLLAQILTYTERFANGLTLYYYDASNPNAKAEMLTAINSQAGNTSLLLPRWGTGRDQNAVERIEVGVANPAFIQSLLDDSFDSAIRRYILGQTLTSDTAPTGLGSGVASAHQDTLSKIIKYDAQNLAETLTSDLIAVLYRYNCPGVPPAKFVFDVDTPNATEVLGNAQIMAELGLALDGDHLYQVTGLPKPAQGDTTVSKLQPMSAVGGAATDAPVGVPAAGEPGPAADPNGEAAAAEAAPYAEASRGGDFKQRFRRRLATRIAAARRVPTPTGRVRRTLNGSRQ